ncbi:MAG TPA: tetratricopeptide repeat protein [Methylomirabilota bacterium]|nr:tetratricopeptide repeat protein [Methylomirabilota bacterium]
MPTATKARKSRLARARRLASHASLLLVVGLVVFWVLARQQVLRMDAVFFHPSWPGIKGLIAYAIGAYGPSAAAYRAHLRGVVQSGGSAGDPWTDAALTGRLDRAELIARAEIARGVDRVTPALALAEIALEQGRPEDARRHLEQALQASPNHPDALLLASVAHLKRGADDEAVAAVRRALRSEPTSPHPLTFVRVLQLLGELDDRRDAARRPALVALYHLYLFRFDPSQASSVLGHAKRALTAGDRRADAYLALGLVHARQGQTDRALAELQRATQAEPRLAEAYRAAATLYGERGDLAGQYRMARAAFEAAPADPLYLETLDGLIAERLADPHAIVEVMERALKFDVHRLRAHRRLGYAYAFVGDEERSLLHYRAAIDLQPGDPVLHEQLGLALFRLGRTDQALDAYQRAIALAPSDPAPRRLLGDLYRFTGRDQEAVREYQVALGLGAGLDGLAKLCDAQYALLALEEALICYETVLELDPRNPFAQGVVPEIKMMLGARSTK